MKPSAVYCVAFVTWMASVMSVFLIARLPVPVKVGFLQSDLVAVGGKAGEGKMILTTKPDGVARIMLYDPAGKATASLEAAPKGSPSLTLGNTAGRTLAAVEIRNGKPRIRLVDPATGKAGWTVTVDESDALQVES